MVYLAESIRAFMKKEAARVLAIANEEIFKLKRRVEASSDYNEIVRLVGVIESIQDAVKVFQGDIPASDWEDYKIRDILDSFVYDADRVLSMCE